MNPGSFGDLSGEPVAGLAFLFSFTVRFNLSSCSIFNLIYCISLLYFFHYLRDYLYRPVATLFDDRDLPTVPCGCV